VPDVPQHQPGVPVFRYGISRASWVMLGLLVLAVAAIAGPRLLLRRDPLAPSAEETMGLALIALVLGGVLLPVPALDILWWLRGRVVVGHEGLRWRAWSGWNELAWEEIVGIGAPRPSGRRTDDTRLHIITADDYQFVHGYQLRGRDEAVDAMQAWGNFPEQVSIGRYVFVCHRDASEQVLRRAEEHVDTGGYDPLDFWSGRFSRM